MDSANAVSVVHEPTIWPLHQTSRDDRSLMGGSTKLEADRTAYRPIPEELRGGGLPSLPQNPCYTYEMADGQKGSAGNDGEYGEQN